MFHVKHLISIGRRFLWSAFYQAGVFHVKHRPITGHGLAEQSALHRSNDELE